MSNNYEGRFVRTSAPAKLTDIKKPKKISFCRRVARFWRAIKSSQYKDLTYEDLKRERIDNNG